MEVKTFLSPPPVPGHPGPCRRGAVARGSGRPAAAAVRALVDGGVVGSMIELIKD
jgi:hypothetical protein